MIHSSDRSRDAPGPGTAVGQVLSCRGSAARIGLRDTAPLGELRATVGKFIVIRSGRDHLIGMIAEISAANDHGGATDYRAIAHVDLMGEIVRDAGRPRFRRGVRDYPAIGDEASIISREDLKLVYSSTGPRSIRVGQLQQDSAIPVHVDVDSLLSKHFAVVGSTGVGKSSGVAVILGEVMRARPDLRILLLDVHNEYGNCFGSHAHVVGSHNLRLPFWLFSFEEIVDVIFGGKPASPEEVEILAELIPVAKAAYMSLKNPRERSLLARKAPRHMGFTPDTPCPYLLQDLLALIDERMGKLENRSTRMVHNRLMMRIETLTNDPRYAFMFENANVGGDTMAAVLNQLFRLEVSTAGITVLKLASLPGEVLDAVVCVACRLAFEFGLWSDGAVPVLIACEEAHRYAAADHSVGFAPARRALSRIAKEGRKYAVHLGLVTQRPAELDPTIMSQCSTLFVMRMANDEDQSLLRSAVSDAAANLLSFVPSLGTGEVVGIGEGLPLPARISFRTLPGNLLPCSEPAGEKPNGHDDWSRGDLVRNAVERWRRATTTTSTVEEEAHCEEVAPASIAPEQDAITRGLRSLAADTASAGPRRVPLDPARYSILKR